MKKIHNTIRATNRRMSYLESPNSKAGQLLRQAIHLVGHYLQENVGVYEHKQYRVRGTQQHTAECLLPCTTTLCQSPDGAYWVLVDHTGVDCTGHVCSAGCRASCIQIILIFGRYYYNQQESENSKGCDQRRAWCENPMYPHEARISPALVHLP